MSRVCEMGGRPSDMLSFVLEAVRRKEKHFVADPNAP